MQKRFFYLTALILLLGLIAVYSNHFHNAFHFDDSHSIVNNVYIRNIHNIPLFFKDASTISSLPANQSYRPLLSTSYAIDYWMGGGLDQFYFQLSTFIWYVLQCILMYFVTLKLLHLHSSAKLNSWIALFTSALYAFHTANAETINYISARSDSISTFWLLVSFAIYVYFPKLRWHGFGIYLIPIIIGILFKQAVLVFPGILFFYLLFFETKFTSQKIFSKENLLSVFRVLLFSFPSLIVCGAMYVLQAKMTPLTFIPGLTSKMDYLITQPYVSLHYFKNFFFPNDLSADTDWVPLTSIMDKKFFVGMIFIILMIVISYFSSRKKNTQGIAFGILWFFISLLPSSSIIPFSEVMNDHRTFLPYIGLIFSIATLLQLIFVKKEKLITARFSFKAGLLFLCLIIIGLHANGTYKRNKVWATDETLWLDVTIKSPNNGRGQMNYGLALMSKGKYAEAEKYFKKAMVIWPNYSYVFVNMGILKNTMGLPDEAEKNFLRGIQLGPMNPEAYYYYAEFLNRIQRRDEAISLLQKAIEISPGHIYSRSLLMNIYADEYQWAELKKLAQETLKILPGDTNATYFLGMSENGKTKLQLAEENAEKAPSPENYLNLSLIFYQENNFDACIRSAQKAIQLKPDYADAYNNIGSAYNQMGKFDSAQIVLKKAIDIRPDYSLAKNNFQLAEKRKVQVKIFSDVIKSKPTEQAHLSLSLFFYNEGMYAKCIESAHDALNMNPNSADAYNNICSAYNNLKKWDEAIRACEQAIKLKPDFQLAKNNLDFAKKRKGN